VVTNLAANDADTILPDMPLGFADAAPASVPVVMGITRLPAIFALAMHP